LLGFKIETDVPSSADFINSIVSTIDDYTYIKNNKTEVKADGGPWEAPWLNFSRAVGGNFSYIPLYYYTFQIDYISYLSDKYSGFNG
jgi:hypothetical protein